MKGIRTVVVTDAEGKVHKFPLAQQVQMSGYGLGQCQDGVWEEVSNPCGHPLDLPSEPCSNEGMFIAVPCNPPS